MVRGRKSFGAAALIVGLLAFTGATSATAQDDEVAPMHNITCSFVQGTNPPWGVTGTAVGGYVQVSCSDRLDNANTRAQIQRYFGGSYQDHGTGVTSYSTGGLTGGRYLIHVYDSAGKQSGGWYYRMKGTHFGQHGNIFSLPTFYSNSRYLTKTS